MRPAWLRVCRQTLLRCIVVQHFWLAGMLLVYPEGGSRTRRAGCYRALGYLGACGECLRGEDGSAEY